MKALPTLIRLARRDLDVLRGELSAIEARRADIRARLAAGAAALAHEQRFAAEHYEAGRAYGGFAARALALRIALEAQAAALEEEAAAVRALIAAAYVELKKVERLAELQEERRVEALQREEMAELDEIATLRASRPRSA